MKYKKKKSRRNFRLFMYISLLNFDHMYFENYLIFVLEFVGVVSLDILVQEFK